MDFTLKKFSDLIDTLQQQNYSFQSVAEFVQNRAEKSIILRHDVDRLPGNSLIFARMENHKGIRGTYYFRIVPESLDKEMIKEISALGHEIGYHYEDVNLVIKKLSGKFQKSDETEFKKQLAAKAIKSFETNLGKLRRIVPVKTICMHGSPFSNWDNRLLWEFYDYRDYDIVAEPYFDIGMNILYLTDTGRKWNGDSINIRDKILNPEKPGSGLNDSRSGYSASYPCSLSYHSTDDIITAAKEGQLPNHFMMTFHPQRWTNRPFPWMKELVWQNTKNVVKYLLHFRNQ